jgi:predicted acetyltransferase
VASPTKAFPKSAGDVALVKPALDWLPGYVDAVARGYARSTFDPSVGQRDLAKIEADAAAFVKGLDDEDATGDPMTLPDGTVVPRIPGFARWIWDGEFCGSISLRWVKGSPTLPPHVSGHIGYSVVAWKRGRGYASRALGLLLPEAKARGLPYVDITTDDDNVASQRVASANGGVLIDRDCKPGAVPPSLLYRIQL